jgi:hypothetical protein
MANNTIAIIVEIINERTSKVIQFIHKHLCLQNPSKQQPVF